MEAIDAEADFLIVIEIFTLLLAAARTLLTFPFVFV